MFLGALISGDGGETTGGRKTNSIMELITVAAVAENGVIGREGELPWPRIQADRRQYRSRIADSPVIVGRTTFDSMRDDPPGTAQIVVSRSEAEFTDNSTYYASGIDEALEVAASLDDDQVYVIGGAKIYDLFQSVVDKMVLSRIPGEYDGDAYFPEWDVTKWHQVKTIDYDEFTLEEWLREER